VSIVLTDSLKKLLTETAFQLKGAGKRKFMAQTVVKLGFGGQRLAEQALGWNRYSIPKGIKELKSSITCVDNSQQELISNLFCFYQLKIKYGSIKVG
jgi:hypothetical protein